MLFVVEREKWGSMTLPVRVVLSTGLSQRRQ
jgi:hypothetical protein